MSAFVPPGREEFEGLKIIIKKPLWGLESRSYCKKLHAKIRYSSRVIGDQILPKTVKF